MRAKTFDAVIGLAHVLERFVRRPKTIDAVILWWRRDLKESLR